MKLYMFPTSTTCRPILLFCAEQDIPIEQVMVDLMTGAHHKEPFISVNPGRRVPVLEDDGLVLTEGSAILKYLATKHAPETYPDEPKLRACINSRMDWFNTGFYMDFAYNLIYPQILPHCQRDSEEVQAATLKWGQQKSREWLSLLNDHLLGPEQKYLCGNTITIADYLATGYLTLGELIGVDLTEFTNVSRWLDRMKALPSYEGVHEAFDGWAASMKEQTFVTLI